MARDSIGRTFTVAFLLCVVCSVLVSGAAVVLRPTQETNELLDKKRNILMAAGLAEEGRTIDELFERIDVRVVDLATGVTSTASIPALTTTSPPPATPTRGWTPRTWAAAPASGAAPS